MIQISSHLGVRVEPVRIEVLFQIQSINEGFLFIYFKKFILFLVNLNGEYVDLTVALATSWLDRLVLN